MHRIIEVEWFIAFIFGVGVTIIVLSLLGNCQWEEESIKYVAGTDARSVNDEKILDIQSRYSIPHDYIHPYSYGTWDVYVSNSPDNAVGINMGNMTSGDWYMLIAMFLAIWMLMIMRFWNKVGIWKQ